MKNNGWNPTRRNRKIGTEDQGFGQDNRFCIPQRWSDDRVFWEKLNNPVKIDLKVRANEFLVFVEPTKKDYTHSCTIDDLEKILNLIPDRYINDIDMFIFRQPKRKEEIVISCWGRIGYWANIGEKSGVAVFLEAQNINQPLKWKKSLTPSHVRELERLREDGLEIEVTKREYIIKQTLDSVRNTQLFRTLLHEIGHNNDPKPVERASQEKEDYAHKFAEKMRSKLISEGSIPFPKIFNKESILACGMNPEWFLNNQ